MDFYVKNVYSYIENNNVMYFTYIGETDIASNIYGGEIGKPDESRDYIKINGLSMVLFTDNLLVIKRNNVQNALRIGGRPFSVNSHEFSTLINAISNNLLDTYSASIINETSQNYDPTNGTLKDIAFPERIVRLLEWNNTKKRLKFNKTSFVPVVARFNVYFAYYGTNIGSEINKLRPVLIWKQHVNKNDIKDNSYFVFPLSTKKAKRNYNYHVEIDVNGTKNYIRINDGRRISIRRLFKPLIDNKSGKTFVLSQNKINEVKSAIKSYFSIK